MAEKILQNFKSLNHFSPEILDELNASLSMMLVERREVIFEQGDSPHYLYGVVQGRIKLLHTTESGKNLLFAICNSGQMIAEAPALGGFPYPASAIAMMSSVLFKLERTVIKDLIRRNPEVGLGFLEFLGQRVVYFAEKLSQMAVLTVHQRIAHVLLEFIDQYGEVDGNSAQLDILLTRQDLADLLGASLETTIRALSLFKKNNILDFDQRRIIIKDCDHLEKVLTASTARSCPLEKNKKNCRAYAT